MRFVRDYLWIAPHFLLLLTILAIFYRRRHRQHPLFLAYLVVQLAYFGSAFTEDFLIFHHLASRDLYLWTLIVGLGFSAVAEVAVLYELTGALIFSRLKKSSSIRTVLRWTLALLLMLGTAVAASLGSSSPERLIAMFQSINVIVYVIALGLLFGIVVLTKALSIPWRSLHAGIALGFGIAAAGELAGTGVLSAIGRSKSGYIAADIVRMSAFHVCALIWLIYVLLPERRPPDRAPALSVTDLENRAEELQRMVQR
jgi:hypothetical protein